MGRFTATAAIAAVIVLAGASASLGQGTPDQSPGRTPPGAASPPIPSAGQVLNEDQIRQKLREEGYSDVTELRLQGPSYEAKATKDGRRVNLTVDARTGSIRSTY